MRRSSASAGGYLILGGLTGFEQFRDTDGADIGDTLGFEVRGGYRIFKYFAAEGEFDFFSGFRLRTEDPEVGDLQIDGATFTANVKAYYPFGRVQPYAIVGLGGIYARVRTEEAVGTICRPGYWGWWCNGVYGQLDEGTDFVAKFGGGLDVYVTEWWAVTLDATYVRPFDELDQLQYISFNWGVMFRFY